jgi:hypothetical protein
MRSARWTLASIFVFAIAVSSTGAQERFESAAAGIALDRPPGWHTATLAQVQANRERVRLSDRQWQATLTKQSVMPLVTFMKYVDSHQGLNPTIQVTLRAALGDTESRLLTMAIDQMRQALPDLRVIVPVGATEISGFPAAHVRVAYTLHTEAGAAFDVTSRLWLITRDRLMFLVGMSGAQTGADVCDAEFRAVLDSIEIRD